MAKPENIAERMEETSADLAYELQSRLFEQLATVSLGGAGLAITLAGSILRGSPFVWFAVVEFGIAALCAISAQQGLIGRLFERRNARGPSKLMTSLCMILIGMGVGSLGFAVWEGNADLAAAASVVTTR